MVNSVKYTLKSAPQISIKLIATMNSQGRGIVCNQWVSTVGSCVQVTTGNKINTLWNFVPVNSKRLPCSLFEKMRRMLHDCVARRSTPTSHEENQSSYFILKTTYTWEQLLLTTSLSLFWTISLNPTHIHHSDRADPLSSSSLSLLTPFLFGVLQVPLWSCLIWLL